MTCTNCDQQAVAYVTAADGGGMTAGGPTFAIVRPLTTHHPLGQPLCADCTHTAVDLMLMRAKEAAT